MGDDEDWLHHASPLHRRILRRLNGVPAPAIEIARDLDAHVWDVSCCLQELQDQYLVGVRKSEDPQFKREYVVTASETQYEQYLDESRPADSIKEQG